MKGKIKLPKGFKYVIDRDKIKSDVHRMLCKLSPRQMKDGTIQ